MHEWLEQARKRLSASTGEEPSTFDLSQRDIDAILELARAAAHESGDRTNAPLLTHLLGVARGRHPDKELTDLVDDILDTSS